MIKLRNLLTENGLPFEKQGGKYIGYRGTFSHPSHRKSDFFGTEGVGLYIAPSIEDARFFGDVYVVTFDPPRKIITAKILPMLHSDDDDAYEAITGELKATDGSWIIAHKIAAQHLKVNTWEKLNKAMLNGDLPRTLTRILLKWGYDAVWTGDWIVLLDTSLCKSMTKLEV